MPPPTLSFLALGIMGAGMAANPLKAGHPLTVWNRPVDKAQPLPALGATIATSPAEAAKNADILFLCVSDTPDVEALLLGDQGVLSAARPGLLVVDHSTISPSATRRIAVTLEQAGVHLLDAPVSGGSE